MPDAVPWMPGSGRGDVTHAVGDAYEIPTIEWPGDPPHGALQGRHARACGACRPNERSVRLGSGPDQVRNPVAAARPRQALRVGMPREGPAGGVAPRAGLQRRHAPSCGACRPNERSVRVGSGPDQVRNRVIPAPLRQALKTGTPGEGPAGGVTPRGGLQGRHVRTCAVCRPYGRSVRLASGPDQVRNPRGRRSPAPGPQDQHARRRIRGRHHTPWGSPRPPRAYMRSVPALWAICEAGFRT